MKASAVKETIKGNRAHSSSSPSPGTPRPSAPTERRLPPSVATLLLTVNGPSARRFERASPERLALAVLAPVARTGAHGRRLEALLRSSGSWPSPAANRLAAHLGGLSEAARTRWVDAMVHRAAQLALGGDEDLVGRLEAQFLKGALAPWPGRAGFTDRAIWLCLAGAAWSAGTPQVRMPAGELSELCGVTTTTVWTALQRLERSGRLAVTDRSAGGLTPNRYRPSSPVPSGRTSLPAAHTLPVSSGSPTETGAVVSAAPCADVEAFVGFGPAAPTVRPTDPALGAAHGLHPGWHPAALGLAAHALCVQLLAASGEPIALRELAVRMGRGAETVRRVVHDTVPLGLAARTRKGVVAGDVLRDAGALEAVLRRAARTGGTERAAAAHRAARMARAAERRSAIESRRVWNGDAGGAARADRRNEVGLVRGELAPTAGEGGGGGDSS